jgi:hypothetical protein
VVVLSEGAIFVAALSTNLYSALSLCFIERAFFSQIQNQSNSLSLSFSLSLSPLSRLFALPMQILPLLLLRLKKHRASRSSSHGSLSLSLSFKATIDYRLKMMPFYKEGACAKVYLGF